MAFDVHSNFGYATVTTAPSPAGSGTTLVLGTATFADFPDPGTIGYNVVVWPAGTIPLSSNSEILRVVTKGTNGTVEVTREQESTSARDITVGDQCGVAITKKVITDIEDRIGSDSWVIGELVNETPNGTITAFTVDNDFLQASTMVFRDGQLMALGTAYDYTEGTAGTINFTTAPAASTNITVTYRKNLEPNGNADTLDGYHASSPPEANKILVLDANALLPTSVLLNGGWIGLGACTYEGADAPTYTISFASDMTSILGAGMRIKLTDSTVKYFIVTAVGAYSGGKTIITVYGGTDYTLSGGAITLPYFSYQKAPIGFPLSPLKWVIETKPSDKSTGSPTSGVWINATNISIPIGVWRITMKFKPTNSYRSSSGRIGTMVTLSTANNSASDNDFTMNNNGSFAASSSEAWVEATMFVEKTLALATKTTYYLNYAAAASGMASVGFTDGIIRLNCAYL